MEVSVVLLVFRLEQTGDLSYMCRKQPVTIIMLKSNYRVRSYVNKHGSDSSKGEGSSSAIVSSSSGTMAKRRLELLNIKQSEKVESH